MFLIETRNNIGFNIKHLCDVFRVYSELRKCFKIIFFVFTDILPLLWPCISPFTFLIKKEKKHLFCCLKLWFSTFGSWRPTKQNTAQLRTHLVLNTTIIKVLTTQK